MAVPVDGMGTVSVAPVKAPPVPGMQKPPRRVGKRFREHLVATPEVKVKKPAGLKTRPAWLQQDRLGANPAVCRGDRVARRGIRGRASLKAADCNHLVSRPNSDGEGAGPQRRTA
jgi:hypothetical protein